MAPPLQCNRWEKIVVAMEDADLHEDDDDDDAQLSEESPGSHHHRTESRVVHQIHVRLESSTTTTTTSTTTTTNTTTSSFPFKMMISPHAHELLQSPLGEVVGEVTTTDTTTTTTTHAHSKIIPTPSSIQWRLHSVHIQVANQPLASYPETRENSDESMMMMIPTTGPSGILVQVTYRPVVVIVPLHSFRSLPPRRTSTIVPAARDHFVTTVLPYLSGQGRILVAPASRSTTQNIQLHRHVHCTTTNTTIECTAMIPHEGAHAALATEGFRSFLPPRRGGIWSLASPREWSHFVLGSGTAIPQSWMEATRTWATTHQAPSAQQLLPPPQRSLIHRRMYWIHWERMTDHNSNNNSNETDTMPEMIEARYGLQYSMNVRPTHPEGLSLNDILPHRQNDQTNQPHYYQSDPLADRSTIEMITSSSSRSHYSLVVGPGRSTTTTTKMRSTNTILEYGIIPPFQNISRTDPLFRRDRPDHPRHTNNLMTDPQTAITSHYWNVQTHLYRSDPGQAYRGTYSGTIQNQLVGCDGIRIQLYQSIPAVLEPIWQSLQIRIHQSSRNTTMTTARPTRWTRLAWHELDSHRVHFHDDGSFVLEMQHIVPSQSVLEIVFDYQPKFINVDYFPADANRGFDIPPLRVQVMNLELDGTDACHEILQQTYHDRVPIVTLYSNALLVLAPLPDMSMPFNVLSFTCTFYVFVIGSLMNLLLKKVSAQMKAKLLDSPKESKIQMLKRKIYNKLQRVFSKVLSSGYVKEKQS